jgi:hypothetical protein
MHTSAPNHPNKYHRFPAEIISHGVWLYYRFCLSYRDVEELLFARGFIVTYEAIRKWCLKFGQAYANQLRRRRPRPGDKWHLDEVFLTINGATALSLACRRPGREHPRYPGATPVGQEGCEEILPQAPQRMPVCSTGHHHG